MKTHRDGALFDCLWIERRAMCPSGTIFYFKKRKKKQYINEQHTYTQKKHPTGNNAVATKRYSVPSSMFRPIQRAHRFCLDTVCSDTLIRQSAHAHTYKYVWFVSLGSMIIVIYTFIYASNRSSTDRPTDTYITHALDKMRF